ncbi:MAG TPA: hypothetical protein DCY06_10750 [Bacteroidetes bacterium]|nr:hypothetical protein [Ignavibacteriaceae bacterium]HAY34601.1 hypothetical protein [Bacteroidota bacterium]HRI46965.1 hypothetical protein [Ignavibacteriaceae bacterium]
MKNKSDKHKGWSIHHGDYEPDNSLRDMELRIKKKQFRVKIVKAIFFIIGASVLLAVILSL